MNKTEVLSELLAATSDYSSIVFGVNNSALKDFNSWSNVTKWTLVQLFDYVVQYYFYRYSNYIANYVTGFMFVFCSAFGFVGSGVQTIVLRGPQFKNKPSYVYHRALISFEFVNMVAMMAISILVNGLSKVIPAQSQPIWFVFMVQNLCFGTQGGLRLITDFITIFITVERTVSLWLPLSFWRVNQNRFAYTAIALSAVTGLLFVPNFGQYDVRTGPTGTAVISIRPYFQWLMENGYTTVRDTVILIKAPVSIVLTAAVISGYIRFKRQRSRLAVPMPQVEAAGPNDVSNSNGASHSNTMPAGFTIRSSSNGKSGFRRPNKQTNKKSLFKKRATAHQTIINNDTVSLTILCLANSVPLALNSITFTLSQEYFVQAMSTGKPAVGLPYEEALQWVTSLGILNILNTFLGNFTYAVGHSCHFYVNYLFCPSFRIAAKSNVFKKYNVL